VGRKLTLALLRCSASKQIFHKEIPNSALEIGELTGSKKI
jgi:hypothetical protein